MTVSQPETTWKLAAQPCSYIYPIYSVVKNHKRESHYCVVAIAPSGGSSIPAQGSNSASQQSLNLKQTSLGETSIDLSSGDGGAERDRTVDPLLAKQVLSQLSYSPITISLPDSYDKGGGPG